MATSIVSNGTIVDEERPGWSLACPSCHSAVRYTVLNVPGEPFLYSDETSDFILRDEDADHVASLDFNDERNANPELRAYYHHLEETLSPCPNGGRFRLLSNVKCPNCRFEFPYNQGVESDVIRCFDPKIIWVEGATAFRGANRASNRLVHVQV